MVRNSSTLETSSCFSCSSLAIINSFEAMKKMRTVFASVSHLHESVRTHPSQMAIQREGPASQFPADMQQDVQRGCMGKK
jgi:hypothetical protein